jgi:hypothetical protein
MGQLIDLYEIHVNFNVISDNLLSHPPNGKVWGPDSDGRGIKVNLTAIHQNG